VETEHSLRGYPEEVVYEDEQLALDVVTQFKPRSDHQTNLNRLQRYQLVSRIFSRRAFVEAEHGELEEATVLMEEAVGAARELERAASDAGKDRASKNLLFLSFHSALMGMRAYEVKGGLDEARTRWADAWAKVQDPKAPTGLVGPSQYFWDRNDIEGYQHVIDAQRAWSEGNFPRAVEEYDSWLNAVTQYSKQWRFRNTEVRRHLSAVISCVAERCSGCDRCRQAIRRLEELERDWWVGNAGRFLAARGVALGRLRASVNLSTIVDECKPYLASDSYKPEPVPGPPEGYFLRALPSYFGSLRDEVSRLTQVESSPDALRDFVTRRFRDFIEVNCEYEEGRVAVLMGTEHPNVSGASLPSLGERIVRARRFRKGLKDKGAFDWISVARALACTEEASDFQTILQQYERVLEKVGGLFPTVVRIINRERKDKTYSAKAQMLTGREITVTSQFGLVGDFGFLPPRHQHNPRDVFLMTHDIPLWVPSSVVEGIYRLQSVPLWEGPWSELKQEHFESFSLDYKEKLPDRIAKHLIAFANTKWGVLIFGIYNPGRAHPDNCVRRLSNEEATEVLDNVALVGLREIEPQISPQFFRAYPGGNLVLVCRVDSSPSAPHRMKSTGKIYTRVGAQSMPISEDEWQSMIKAKSGGGN
jgi:hypothetical protein